MKSIDLGVCSVKLSILTHNRREDLVFSTLWTNQSAPNMSFILNVHWMFFMERCPLHSTFVQVQKRVSVFVIQLSGWVTSVDLRQLNCTTADFDGGCWSQQYCWGRGEIHWAQQDYQRRKRLTRHNSLWLGSGSQSFEARPTWNNTLTPQQGSAVYERERHTCLLLKNRRSAVDGNWYCLTRLTRDI